eukprot:5245482-Amphidinium_carterae.1
MHHFWLCIATAAERTVPEPHGVSQPPWDSRGLKSCSDFCRRLNLSAAYVQYCNVVCGHGGFEEPEQN